MKVAIAATPVVAGLFLAPLVLGPRVGPSGGAGTAEPTVVLPAGTWSSPSPSKAPATPAAGSQHRPGDRTTSTPAPAPGAPKSARTLVELHPAGTPVKVTKERKPDDTPPLCLVGRVQRCVNLPGPLRPHPILR
jgi:hypothetical protein